MVCLHTKALKHVEHDIDTTLTHHGHNQLWLGGGGCDRWQLLHNCIIYRNVEIFKTYFL
jgi:hypothetical protein